MKKVYILNILFPLITLLFYSCENEFDYRRIVNAVKTIQSSNVTQTSAEVSGNVITDNGSNLIAKGICYSTENNPNVNGAKVVFDSAILGSYSCTLTDLAPSTTYYARAYATNSYGTAYGAIISFTTLQATVPILSSTTAASLITATTASSGGTISNSGASTITSRGVCYSSTVSVPTISDPKTNNGTGIGTFTSQLTGLTANTTYYIRAYATNSIGTAYGDVKTFNTSVATIPTGVTTNTLSSITQNTASCGGNVTFDGGSAVTLRGVCWSSTNSSPTTANSKTTDGSGIGSFTSLLTALTPGTTYYVRAYATNGVGTAYGVTRVFNTLAANPPSGITTVTISSITQNSALSGGIINNDGGASISAKGVCWSSTNTQPTILNSTVTNNGTGINSFSSNITGLNSGTTYYVRAYATNSAGTGYGNVISFTTSPNLSVGQTYQGGIIGYIFAPGDSGYVAGQVHGLIVAVSNQSTGAQWGCSGTQISGTNTTLGSGNSNTQAIVGICSSSTIAAALCNNLISGGYSDWYLPSRDELNKLYSNKGSIGGFANASYWSSSQSSTSATTNAISINFGTGVISNNLKTNSFYVRAIRKF